MNKFQNFKAARCWLSHFVETKSNKPKQTGQAFLKVCQTVLCPLKEDTGLFDRRQSVRSVKGEDSSRIIELIPHPILSLLPNRQAGLP